MTLRGEGIAHEFQQVVQDYIEKRFGATAGEGPQVPAPHA
jgi:(E)-4-hydroxy-3-methylbut-2-enyl-diphosphate synthase